MALEIREKVFCREHPGMATTLNNLAGLLRSKGDYEGAEPLYRRALEISEKVLGREHPDTARSLNNLAELLRSKGDYEGAEPLYRRALEIREKVLGREHPDMVTTLNSLAGLLSSKGDYEGAEPLYRRALEICEKVLGREHPDTAASLYNLGALFFIKGDSASAVPYYQRALDVYEKIRGHSISATPQRLTRMAICHNQIAFHGDVPVKNWKSAEAHYRKAIEIFKSAQDQKETANAELNLQTMYWLAGKEDGNMRENVAEERVQELTEILEDAGDPRAEKGHKLLRELS